MTSPLTSSRRLLKDLNFVLILLAGAAATFPLLVPPFFIPLYGQSIGLSSRVGAALLAAFNFSSAVGRILCGQMCDMIGAVNTLFVSLLITALSMLAIWPFSTTFAPLLAFSIINGLSNGGFFSIMPTVVGNVFGSARVSVAMGMIVTSWGAGYLMVIDVHLNTKPICVLNSDNFFLGRTNRWLPTRCSRRTG